MRSITVLEPGLLTTVQDLGRDGYGRIGVSPAAAADPAALRIGNRLAGNPDGAAALEMTLQGGAFRFEEAAVVAVTGSDFGPAIEGRPVPLWTACEVRAGQTLRLSTTRGGARSYLAIQGGIAVPRLLGSASTHILSGLGGLEGRALRRGDLLQIGGAEGATAGPGQTPSPRAAASLGPPGAHGSPGCVDPRLLARLAPRKTLRVTNGLQAERFSAEARRLLTGAPYIVTEESNRMGLRLKGGTVPPPHGGQMLTEGVPLGAVQIPPGGQPIILFVDQQTTGGYPVIASVITADLPSVGQLRPRDEIRFERVTLDAALSLAREQEEWLSSASPLLP